MTLSLMWMMIKREQQQLVWKPMDTALRALTQAPWTMASTGNTSLHPCHQLALLLFRLLYYFVLWTLCDLSMSAPLRPCCPWKAL